MKKHLFIFVMLTPFLWAQIAEEITIPDISVNTNVIEETSFLVMQETTPGMKQPVIHGLMGDKILITLDNNKFSNSLFRAGPNQYYSWVPDQFIFSNTVNETLLNSSLGGTIDRTLGIKKKEINIEIGSNVFAGTVTYRSKSFQAGVTVTDNGNVITPDGEVKHSGYNQKALFLGVDHENSTTKFIFSQSDDIDRTDKFEKGDYYVYDLQRYIMLSHEYCIPETNIVLMPSWQQFREKIDRHDPQRRNINSTNNIFGFVGSNSITNIFNETDSFKYGLTDHYEDISYSKGFLTKNYYYNIFSLWCSYKNIVKDNFEYRITYNFSFLKTAGGSIDRRMTGNAVGVGANYYVSDTLYLYGTLNSNFKFPTITNLAEARSDSVEEIANPYIDCEKALTAKIGIFYQGIDISIFKKKLYDMIIRMQTNIPDGKDSYKWRYENTDKGYIDGLKFSYSNIFWGNWEMRLNMEVLNGKTDYDYISKLQPFASAIYVKYKDIWTEFLYAPRVPIDRMALKDKNDIRIKNHNNGYRILNFGYSYKYKNHGLTFYLDNAFNSSGRVYGSSVDFNKRRVRIKYSYHFK